MDPSNCLPRLNEKAPDFEVKTTDGKRKLADYNQLIAPIRTSHGSVVSIRTSKSHMPME